MENLFNHYYMFQENKKTDKWLNLIKKIGNYQLLENPDEITKLAIIQTENIYLHRNNGGKLRLINPLYQEQIGLCKRENNDTIIIVSNFAKGTTEFFISDSTKKAELFIYELINQKELDMELSIMRERAYSLS